MVTSEVFILPLFVNVAIQHDTSFDHSCSLFMILKNRCHPAAYCIPSISNFDSSNESGRELETLSQVDKYKNVTLVEKLLKMFKNPTFQLLLLFLE